MASPVIRSGVQGSPQKRQTKIDSAATAKASVPKFSFIRGLEIALLRRRSRGRRGAQRHVSGVLRRSPGLGLLFVGQTGLVAGGGGSLLLFLAGGITSQAQWTGLRLTVGNLGGVRRGGRQSIDPGALDLGFGLGLPGNLGASAVAGLLRRPGRLQRIHRLRRGSG